MSIVLLAGHNEGHIEKELFAAQVVEAGKDCPTVAGKLKSGAGFLLSQLHGSVR